MRPIKTTALLALLALLAGGASGCANLEARLDCLAAAGDREAFACQYADLQDRETAGDPLLSTMLGAVALIGVDALAAWSATWHP